MVPVADLALIFGTAVSVGGAVALGGRWVVRAIFREDVQPLRETMLKLEHTVSDLVDEMRESREVQRADRDEMRAAVAALQKIVADHDARLIAIESAAPKPRRIRSAKP